MSKRRSFPAPWTLAVALTVGSVLAGPTLPAQGQVTFSAPDICAEPGATVIPVPISLDNATAVRAVSFSLQDSPDELQLVSGTGGAACTDRTSGFTCTGNEVGASNLINALVVSLGGGSIAAGTTPVIVLTLSDGSVACTPGEQVALNLSNVVVADENNMPLAATVVNGSFTCGCGGTTTTSSTSTSTTVPSTTTTTTVTTSTSTTLVPPIGCCVVSSPTGAFDTCILVGGSAECTAQNGIPAGSASCSPNPCPPTTTTTTVAPPTTTTTSSTTSSTGAPPTTTTTQPPPSVTVSAPDICADPGATAIPVPISLDNVTAVRAVSFSLQDSPDELQLVSGTGGAACTDRTTGFTCTGNEVGASNLINALVVSLGGGDIAAGIGPVIVLTLTDGPVACTPGEQVALNLSNVVVADANNMPLAATVVNGSFTCGCGGTTTTSSTSTSTTVPSTTTTTTVTTSTSTTLVPPVACCVASSPTGAFDVCILVSGSAECTAQNGIPTASTSCSPNPCPPSTTTTSTPPTTSTTSSTAPTTTSTTSTSTTSSVPTTTSSSSTSTLPTTTTILATTTTTRTSTSSTSSSTTRPSTTTTTMPSQCLLSLGAATGCTVLQLGGGKVATSGPTGGVVGDVCIGSNGSLSMSGSQFVTGNVRLGAGAHLNKSGATSVGAVQTGVDLSAEIADAEAAATTTAMEPCTQSLGTLKSTQTIAGNGGLNVICVHDVTLDGGAVVTLEGSATDRFLLNVTGKFKLTGGSRIELAGGVQSQDVLYNIIGPGEGVAFSGGGGGVGCCRTAIEGTVLAPERKVAISPALIGGAVISGRDISMSGGGRIRGPSLDCLLFATTTSSTSTTATSSTSTTRPISTTTSSTSSSTTSPTTTTTTLPSQCLLSLGAATDCTVLQLGGGSVAMSGGPGGVAGDACIGPNGKLSMSGSQFVSGTVRLGAGAQLNKSGSTSVGTVQTGVDLSAEIADALAAAASAAAEQCTQTPSTLKGRQTIAGNGGLNVICVHDVTLDGGVVLILGGGATDRFVLNVTGKFKLTGGSRIQVSGGARSQNVLYNIIGPGEDVAFTGGAAIDGTVLAPDRKVAITPGSIGGAVISGRDISVSGGGRVQGPSVNCLLCPPGVPFCTPNGSIAERLSAADLAPTIALAFASPLCVGEPGPAALTRRLEHARRVLERAASGHDERKATKAVRRLVRHLKVSARIVGEAANSGKLSIRCAQALDTMLGDAQVQSERWLSTR